MKRGLILIMLASLLCGCSPSQPAEPVPPTEPETTVSVPTAEPETSVPETEHFDPVEDLLCRMTLREKVGQLFLARCPGETAIEDLQTYHLGGYVLFGSDISGQTPETLRETLRTYQQSSAIPMLIAVDEEGGTVTRISSDPAFRSSKFLSPRELYAKGGMELVLDTETEKAALLWDLGINVVLGPVCDVSQTPGAFMYKRSIGLDAGDTRSFAAGAVERMASFGVGSVLKHFPGYGDNVDTHTGIAVDNRSMDALLASDLVPFAAGVGADAAGIMMSHNIVNCMDPDYPASLSPKVHSYLRSQMGFTGPILTDDLDMAAITEQYGSGEAAVLAVLAGNSILCTGSYDVQYDAVLEAVETGRISQGLLDSAVKTVLLWKQSLNLI